MSSTGMDGPHRPTVTVVMALSTKIIIIMDKERKKEKLYISCMIELHVTAIIRILLLYHMNY